VKLPVFPQVFSVRGYLLMQIVAFALRFLEGWMIFSYQGYKVGGCGREFAAESSPASQCQVDRAEGKN
jgi:hypothetical protein